MVVVSWSIRVIAEVNTLGNHLLSTLVKGETYKNIITSAPPTPCIILGCFAEWTQTIAVNYCYQALMLPSALADNSLLLVCPSLKPNRQLCWWHTRVGRQMCYLANIHGP